MIKFPRLKTFLSIFPLSETSWGLRGGADEMWRIKLTDERAIRALGALLPYLNGRTATEDILRAVESAGIATCRWPGLHQVGRAGRGLVYSDFADDGRAGWQGSDHVHLELGAAEGRVERVVVDPEGAVRISPERNVVPLDRRERGQRIVPDRQGSHAGIGGASDGVDCLAQVQTSVCIPAF